jgi:hypothetical protein
VTDYSGIVTDDSGQSRKSVTFDQNRRSRSVGTTGHVQTESAVNMVRNTHTPDATVAAHETSHENRSRAWGVEFVRRTPMKIVMGRSAPTDRE